jgi:hypothetical protein
MCIKDFFKQIAARRKLREIHLKAVSAGVDSATLSEAQQTLESRFDRMYQWINNEDLSARIMFDRQVEERYKKEYPNSYIPWLKYCDLLKAAVQASLKESQEHIDMAQKSTNLKSRRDYDDVHTSVQRIETSVKVFTEWYKQVDERIKTFLDQATEAGDKLFHQKTMYAPRRQYISLELRAPQK